MDLTREFIEKIEEMSVPNTIETGGRVFTDKVMTALPTEPKLDCVLETESLTSVVAYLTGKVDGNVLNGRPIVHVLGPQDVHLYTELNLDKRRNHPLHAAANVNKFPFGRFIPLEDFIINVQSNFVQDENTASLLNFVATVRQDSNVEQQDDGVSQRVATRQGVSLSTSSKVPNPVTLRPYRTFPEVEQPAGQFVFRLRGDGDGVTAALFEADGGAWKHTAICSIADYFNEHLPQSLGVIILA